MLRTNLSTKPFYNERVVLLLLGAAGVLVAALTVFNIVRYTTLSAQDRGLAGTTRATEQAVVGLRQQAARARSGIDRNQLETVVAAAREANVLIDGRTFSWTELLNRLEATLPPDVRIQAIAPVPRREGDPLKLRLVVRARRAEDVEAFVGELETSGGFREVVSQAETVTPEGLVEVTLEGQYLAARQGVATAPPPEADPGPPE